VTPTGTGIEKNVIPLTQTHPALLFNSVKNTLTITNCSASSYTIADVSGRLLKSGNLPIAKAFEIGVSDLSNGVYILQVFGNGRNGIFRFLKRS
jgi:hypothetical protein